MVASSFWQIYVAQGLLLSSFVEHLIVVEETNSLQIKNTEALELPEVRQLLNEHSEPGLTSKLRKIQFFYN